MTARPFVPRNPNEDDLAAARGILAGLAISLPVWIVMGVVAWRWGA